MAKKKQSTDTYRIDDKFLDVLISIENDIYEKLDPEIEKYHAMVQAWENALAKEKELQAEVDIRQAAYDTESAWIDDNPNYATVLDVALERLVSLQEILPNDDRLVRMAQAHVDAIKQGKKVALAPKFNALQAAKSALLAQQEHMRTPGKLACKAAHERMIVEGKLTPNS